MRPIFRDPRPKWSPTCSSAHYPGGGQVSCVRPLVGEKEWRKPGKEEEEEEEEEKRQEGIMMAVDDSEGSVVSEFQRKKGRFKGQKGQN